MNISRHTIIILSIFILCVSFSHAYDPADGDFARENADDIRILSYNVLINFVSDVSLTNNEFTRIFQAIDPDIIAFQEMNNTVPVASVEAELQTILGGTWSAHAGLTTAPIRSVVATRHGISLQVSDTTPAAGTRGVTAGLVDLPDGTYGATDLYVMGVHMKSGGSATDDQNRQQTADAIINWMRDARTAGGNITLPANTPMIVVGDTNLGFNDVGDEIPYHATRTLLDGDIFDEGTFGSDSPPDWDDTNLTDAAPYDHNNAEVRTQPSEAPGSRFDRFIYTDSAMRMVNRFVLNTQTMTSTALTNSGLQANDTADAFGGASDHLPVVVDFRLGADPNPPGELRINEFIYNDTGGDDRNFIELINVGGREIVLDAPVDYHLLRSDSNLPIADPGSGVEDQAFYYDLVGVVPAGGLFVLYDVGDQSNAVSAEIETNLPALQRQARSDFQLVNSNNIGLALVTRTPIDDGAFDFDHALVEAYLYDDNNAGSDNFFRTDSSNSLLITLGADQRTPFGSATDDSFSRTVGNTNVNTYQNWVITDTATPGTVNSTIVPVELSVFSVQ